MRESRDSRIYELSLVSTTRPRDRAETCLKDIVVPNAETIDMIPLNETMLAEGLFDTANDYTSNPPCYLPVKSALDSKHILLREKPALRTRSKFGS